MPTSIALTPHFEKLTKQLVASGEYNNVSEVVREGLRLVEERKKKQRLAMRELRTAVQAGMKQLANGEYQDFETQKEFSDYLKTAVQRAHAKILSKPKTTRQAA